MKFKPFFTSFMEAGCDEAGRGCLAGPVVAAAVILPNRYQNKQLNDSKKLSEKLRIKLRCEINDKALAVGIGIVSEKKIDEINILQASLLAMHYAIKNLKIKPHYLVVDGNKFNIAAASIIAKTTRDDLMKELSKEFPNYEWKQNKGYPTKKHRLAISKYGVTKYHRRSFSLTKT